MTRTTAGAASWSGSSLLSRPLVAAVRAYQLTLSPVLGARCRYYPTCSHYAIGALRTHGPLTGLALGAWRLLRCHPWTAGGIDHVPARGAVVTYLHDRDAAGCGQVRATDAFPTPTTLPRPSASAPHAA